jgi:K+-transporting ATPase ATPase A chain
MTLNGWLQIGIFTAIVVLLTRPLGGYMTRLFSGERTVLSPVLRPLEHGLYRLAGIDERVEQHWLTYTVAMLVFNLACFLSLYALLRLQDLLPFNPQGMAAVSPDLAFNTAVSFITNTSWQSYSGETTLSYLSQMAGITVHSFLSAATGIVLAMALVRGFARGTSATVGNFWVDLVRCTLYLLLPVCVICALFFAWQGVPQNLGVYTEATSLEGVKQVIAQGPVASQDVIKLLSSDGGGFFNANSAHPFENPTAATNLVEMVLIVLIGAAMTNVFGRMVGDQRQGWAIFAAMGSLFLVGVVVCYWAEASGNLTWTASGVDPSGGNMEGKEVRFGIANTALFTTVTTDASCGAVNSMLDSLTPLGGMVPLTNILLGEAIFGGVGSGLYGMLLYIIIAMFVAGLMVGRTPEYVGKKLEIREIKMTMLALLVVPLVNIGLTSVASAIPAGVAGIGNSGPHGFSEILYAYVSAAGNNGSAFAGLSVNTPWYNLTLALAMFVGRFALIVPMMAIAGSLAAKKRLPPSLGTFPTTGPLFVSLLVGTMLIVVGLTYFPALALGPVVEHLLMNSGTVF